MKQTFSRPREKFLVLELSRNGTAGLFLSVDEERNIKLEKLKKNIDLKKLFKSPAWRLSQKEWEGKSLFRFRRKVIVSADSTLATTIPIPLDLAREHDLAKSEIILSELENLIAQAMGKIFNQCRSEAAKRLAIDDLDTILVGAKAKHFKVDGNSVVNPVGFSGKKISLLLELTFTGRTIFEDFKSFFNSSEDFFFAESPQARLSSLARARKLPLNLIVADDDRTSLYVLEKTKDQHPVLYRETLGWRFDALFGRIMEELGVKAATARELYHMYLTEKMSETAGRALKKAIEPALEEFWGEIKKGKLHGFAYVDAKEALPFALPYRREGAVFDHFPIGELLAGLSFSADRSNVDEPDGTISRHLLPFVEAYFDKSNSEINQKLRRRLHWLLH